MKKIKLMLILLISIFIFNIKVFAGASLSVSKTSVTKGDSFTVSVNMSSVAAWNIHVTASGPVSGCSINQADATADALDTSKTFSATCTTTGVGTININLSGDVTSATDGIPVMLSGNATVTVNEPAPTPTPSPEPTPTPGPSPAPTPQPSNPQNNLSTNNNLKILSIEGYEIVKVDNNNYTLIVSNNVTGVNVKAEAEDSKATITGVGSHELKVGENNIEVIVTSESGVQNKINIKVTRKDGYYLEDLNNVLNDKNINDADIIINSDSKLTQEQIEQIKGSNKILRLNYYDQNKKLIYSWTVNGKEIKDSKEFTTTITYTSENIKEIYKLSNYADGLYVKFNHNGDLPQGTKVKLYVGDKFENESIVNVYHYNINDKKLDFIKDNLKVVDGYIEFDIEHCSEYFVTMSTIGNIEKQESSSNIFMIFTIIEFIIIVGLVIFIFIKIKPIKKEEVIKVVENKDELLNNTINTYNNEANNINNEYNTQENNTNNNQDY